MHMEQEIEAVPLQRAPQIRVCAEAFAFVEGDKLDVRDVSEQTALELSHDPGELRSGPRCLQRAYDGQRVTTVTDGGQSQETDAPRRTSEIECAGGHHARHPGDTRP